MKKKAGNFADFLLFQSPVPASHEKLKQNHKICISFCNILYYIMQYRRLR